VPGVTPRANECACTAACPRIPASDHAVDTSDSHLHSRHTESHPQNYRRVQFDRQPLLIVHSAVPSRHCVRSLIGEMGTRPTQTKNTPN